MIDLCFHYDNKFRNFWDQLVRTYKINEAYEVGTPEDVGLGPWTGISDISDLDGQIIFFSPKNGVNMPGVINLKDFTHVENATYCFGSDEEHSPLVDCDCVVYIETPDNSPLWASQAASIVLQDRFIRGNY